MPTIESPEMPDVYTFILVISGESEPTSTETVAALCPDATFGRTGGAHFAEFRRRSSSFRHAVSTAIRTIESADGLRVRRLEPDDLVSASEIAERLGRSRESVRLLAAGQRGDGRFPSPVSHLHTRQRLWRWTDVAAWSGDLDAERRDQAEYVAAVNAALELRYHRQSADDFVVSLVNQTLGEETSPSSPPDPATSDPATSDPPTPQPPRRRRLMTPRKAGSTWRGRR
jgi:hypothetical protein